jgi:hypothetical protein
MGEGENRMGENTGVDNTVRKRAILLFLQILNTEPWELGCCAVQPA